MSLKDTFLASLVPIFLGFGFVIAKPAMEHFPPFLLMGLRFTFAASILIWWFPIPRGFLKKIFIVSLIANTVQYGITYTGLSMIDASAAVLLVQMEVIFGVVFAYFMLKEKPTTRSLIGISIAFIGVYILTGSPNLDGKFIGAALTVTGAGIWALGQVLVKPLSKEINPLVLVAWLGLFSGPLLITLSAIFDGNPIPYILSANLNSWLTVIFLGFIMQPIGYAAWYYVLKKYPVNKVMPVLLILPVTGLLTSIFLLGEDPPKQVFLGGLVIISGVGMILFTRSNKKNRR